MRFEKPEMLIFMWLDCLWKCDLIFSENDFKMTLKRIKNVFTNKMVFYKFHKAEGLEFEKHSWKWSWGQVTECL